MSHDDTERSIAASQSLGRMVDALCRLPEGASFDEAPAELAEELMESILNAAPYLDDIHPEVASELLAWAHDRMERRDYPEFFAALDEIKRIRDAHGDEALNSPAHFSLFAKMYRMSPPRYKAEADSILSDALPTATHVNEDGKPLYSAQQVADVLGVNEEEVEDAIQELEESGLFDSRYTGPAYPIQ